MTVPIEIRDRYLRDPLPIRLGGLAANLARVGSFSDNPDHGAAVERLIEESAWFVEWAAREAPIEKQIALIDCQRQLARWRVSWPGAWSDPARRARMAEVAVAWSRRILDLSGLLRSAAKPAATGDG